MKIYISLISFGLFVSFPYSSFGQQIQSISNSPFNESTNDNKYQLRQAQKVQILKSSSADKINNSNFYIKIFPNPFKENLTINFGKLMNVDVELKIFDMLGKLTAQFKINMENDILQKVLDLSHLENGIYLIELSSKDGANLMNYKIVKLAQD
ncbi:MAG: T9SS type A sorting domain-containing protein [Bacteroidetes bacterium]|nr:T9SS type A sorting domain-containing protein [Bacteroidota bacterium]